VLARVGEGERGAAAAGGGEGETHQRLHLRQLDAQPEAAEHGGQGEDLPGAVRPGAAAQAYEDCAEREQEHHYRAHDDAVRGLVVGDDLEGGADDRGAAGAGIA